MFPQLIVRDPAHTNSAWIVRERDVWLYNVNGKCMNNGFQGPLLTFASRDSVHVAKAMVLAAGAVTFKGTFTCGMPARLSRYITLFPNRIISDYDGNVWYQNLCDAMYEIDTLVLNVQSETKYDVEIPLESNDITPWLPFALFALYSMPRKPASDNSTASEGSKTNGDKAKSQLVCTGKGFAEYLGKFFNGVTWSARMMDACIDLLAKFRKNKKNN